MLADFLETTSAGPGSRVVAVRGSQSQLEKANNAHPQAVEDGDSRPRSRDNTVTAAGPPGPGACNGQVGPYPTNTTPDIPQNGQLYQLRMQGVVESTDHAFTGIGNENGAYTPWTCVQDMTNGLYAKKYPKYAYEHDYKVNQCERGAYVSLDDYYWESNLPGAYQDTRALDSDCEVDFTIGSYLGWSLDSDATYTIRTTVTAAHEANRARGLLTASVMPIDNISPQGNPCTVNYTDSNRDFTYDESEIDPNFVPDPWCVAGYSQGPARAASYIALPPNGFAIRYDGKCYTWALGAGATAC